VETISVVCVQPIARAFDAATAFIAGRPPL